MRQKGRVFRGWCMLNKVENGLKLLFRLSSNVRYHALTFGVLLHSGLMVSDRMLVNTQ
jgi:hypothetical protein